MGNQAHRPAGLILVRHSIPDIREDRPNPEWRLSQAGRADARRLGARLAAYAPQAAVASPEPKALETARIIAEPLGLSVEVDADLAEHRRPGLRYGERDVFHAIMADWFAHPAERRFDGESLDDAHDRFAAALERLAGPATLVASHGTVMTLFLSRRLGLEPFALWASLALPEAFVLDGGGDLMERVGVQ
uniref:histidine phosphatase family protein n=1 Tax=Phenylobacterium sp. TaxID=1871053 RepID=UPI00286AD616